MRAFAAMAAGEPPIVDLPSVTTKMAWIARGLSSGLTSCLIRLKAAVVAVPPPLGC